MQIDKSWLRKVGVGVFALAMVGVTANAGVISAGNSDSFGIKADNTLFGWGFDGDTHNDIDANLITQTAVPNAQLGLGPTNTMANGAYVAAPTQSGTAKTWVDVVGGTSRGFGIQADGSLWGWGYDGAPEASFLGSDYVNRFHYEQGGELGMGAQLCQTISLVHDASISTWTTNFSGGAGNHDGGAGNELYTSKDVDSTITPAYTNSVMNGLTTNRPAQVGSDTSWRQVAVGGDFGLGLQADGSIWSWGADGQTITTQTNTNGFDLITLCQAWGQLGQGDRVVSTTNYAGGDSYTVITQHYTNSATNLPYAWTLDSTTTNAYTIAVTTNFVQYALSLNTPTKIAAPMSMDCVAAGASHSAAVGSDGSLWTWGKNKGGTYLASVSTNDYVWFIADGVTNYLHELVPNTYNTNNGILGLGDSMFFATNVPTRVGSETTWASVSAGLNANFTLAIKKDGSLWGWGENGDQSDYSWLGGGGVWGDGAYYYDQTATATNTSVIWRWAQGWLGLGSNVLIATTPTQVGTDKNWAMVSAGNAHCLGLKSDGSLWAWGNNGNGRLGLGRDDAYVPVPTRVGADNDWVAISAGYDHSLALKLDGSLYAWGANAYAQLGDQLGDAYEPVLIGSGWGLAAAEGDFDGDGLADPYAVVNGGWTFWFSSWSYVPTGPYVMAVPGGVPVVADFDGDGLADPAMVANGGWTFWFSSWGYVPTGPYVMSVPGGVPVAGDFDGDRLADPAMVASGNWTFWYSRGGYLPVGSYVMSVPGGVPVAGDFDGDRLADSAMVANGAWTFWFSSDVNNLPSGPYVMSVPGGQPMVGDFDGDGLADPTMVHNNNWTLWLSSGGWLPYGPYPFVP